MDLTTRSSGEKVTPNLKGGKRSGILGRLQNLADFKTSTKIDALVCRTTKSTYFVVFSSNCICYHTFYVCLKEENQNQCILLNVFLEVI